jgi:beta-fructofuranosidase
MKNDWRQMLHLEPKSGWLNDPNGLSFFNNKYHVYFQYAPESAYGAGGKCWGHWESPDLLKWRFTGIVLRPDCPDDRSGVYSGCGFVKGDTLNLFYTGNVKEEGDHDYITSGRGANVIRVTTRDGMTMSEKQTLLRNADYPGYCSCHVRDPKVWEENGVYRMVLGARTLDDKGCVLFYRSDDLVKWSFDYELSVPDFGYMWECPDVIDIDGRRFLGISPQGLPHGEAEHQNVYSAGYFRYDDTLHDFEEWDYGFDFYAPQTFTAPDGRILLIGWMGIGDIPYTNPTAELGWQHCLTLPRELTVRTDGGIYQRPVREYNALKGKPVNLEKDGTLKTELPFYFASLAPLDKFTLVFEDMLEMSFGDGIFMLRFTNNEIGSGRDVRRVRLGRFMGIEIIADKSSLEIYLNGGEKVMSTRFYPPDTAVKIRGEGIGGSVYRLKGMEMEMFGDE